MKNILITGASGFLGSHLFESILKYTNYNIIILKRSFSDIYRIKKYINSERVISLNIDEQKLEDIFINYNIDSIIHCATNYGRGNASCTKVIETNLIFPIELLELATKYNVKSFINTDSYFNKENYSYPYLINYSLSKKCLLNWLQYFSSKIQIANVVLEHIYGENDNVNKFVYEMIEKIAIQQVDSLDLTLGNQKRDFVYIKDVVNAYIKILEDIEINDYSFKTFNVGTGYSTEIKQFVETIKSISNSKTQLNFGAIPYRENEIMDSYANIENLLSIGWEPKYSIQDGLKSTIEGDI